MEIIYNISLLDFPTNTSVPDSVLQAIYYMADHLPVICKVKVQLPEVHKVTYLDLKVYLEGAFNGTNMNVISSSTLPEGQPFSQAPWNYYGSETSSAYQTDNVTDWVLVELRETSGNANMATSDTKIWEQACLLLNDGSIINANDYHLPYIDFTIDNNLYAVIKHRNHLDIISANSINLIDSLYSYDYSISGNQVFGTTDGYKEIFPGTWGMVSGDANVDGEINELDKVIWINQVGNKGYLPSDFKMDTQIDNMDKNIFWYINQGYTSLIPE